ncbi:MAG: hypothetical protein CEO22_567 [Candidatus Berkelbacteria bacterium Gr01-1014_85]|uniref:Uncharacterized protein n=1 Tax=Candidatus Berkelbacteria bacterium Gr01-1014_85 TaxID=2017150 RepID=A0A554JA64_9BACT|nr:MAG: hypothetical protein CEO22_567 [Candidatus Berkelbacteria bacterium Gr01-1014_85]
MSTQNKDQDPHRVITRHSWTIIIYAVAWLVVYFWVAPELELPRTFALCLSTVISGVPALIGHLALWVYLELISLRDQDSP